VKTVMTYILVTTALGLMKSVLKREGYFTVV